ncbi:hypothetical protein EYC98_16050 [Halieaceae bacterium IMCC14734]|uniref:Tetratricopeptide repeat protein n=1 Tax=Candidatus Litorirhabdus singularis TaxID=2518993 RepID=A0ABT3TJ73_9GAMM|nr:hypothetical protein [Candidatus Litorirhabdus singularis]MCX2982377.1 hypothetical protein [Candidatus Litorirhabdus singularis]
MPAVPLVRHWIVLLLMCAAAYWLGLGSAFLFDSGPAIAKNSALVFDSGNFIQWYNALFSSASGPTGRPLSMLSFALNTQMSGELSAWAMKFTNLLLHGGMALLAYQLIRRLLILSPQIDIDEQRASWLAATAAALWLLHPLQVSTVLYAVQRMEQLAALATLAALLVYVSYRPRWLQRAPTASELSACLFGLVLSLTVGILCKEDAILMIPLVLLVELVFFDGQVAGRRYALIPAICALAVFSPLLLMATVVWWQPDFILRGYWTRDFNLEERLLTQARVLWSYLGWTLVPDIRPLALHHDDVLVSRGWWQPYTTALAVGGWLAAIGVAVFWRHRWPLLSFALGWYLLLHSLEANVLPLELAWEHRNYLPSLGVCLLVAWVIWSLLPLSVLRQRLLISGLLVLVLGLQLFNRASLWGDEEVMAAYHLHHHPQSLRSSYHYANLQLRLAESATAKSEQQRRLVLARQGYITMLELDAGSFTALTTLLYLDSRYFGPQEDGDWVRQLTEAAATRSLNNNDHAALGLLMKCISEGQCDISDESYIGIMQTLIARYPQRPHYLHNLAAFYGNVKMDYPQALALHARLLDSFPNNLDAWDGMAAWYNRSGELGQALEALRASLAADAGPQRVRHVITSFAEEAP